MESSKLRRKPIKVFQDLEVYQNLYKGVVLIHKQVIPRLPKEERFDLVDQMRRASKAGPALIAEGFAKRYQKRQWRKYISDAMGECNEMIHHLSICKDIYNRYVNVDLCNEIIDLYEISCKQLTNLRKSWQDFHAKDRN